MTSQDIRHDLKIKKSNIEIRPHERQKTRRVSDRQDRADIQKEWKIPKRMSYHQIFKESNTYRTDIPEDEVCEEELRIIEVRCKEQLTEWRGNPASVERLNANHDSSDWSSEKVD